MRKPTPAWAFVVVTIPFTACLPACSHHDAEKIAIDGGDGGPHPARGAFDPKTVEELHALGYDKYDERAVVTEEQPEAGGSPARVSFDPASGPLCIYGDPYSVYYADRHSEDLVILLDAGGACWSSLCSTNPTVSNFVSDYARFLAFPDAPSAGGTTVGPDPGAKNFAGWNAVSIPYCDGSVFMGDDDYAPAAGPVRHYRGRENLAAGLDVAVEHFPEPKRVLLVGWSAGGYGTLSAMLTTRLRYPAADLYVLDDSGPGLFNVGATGDMEQRLDEWKYGDIIPASCRECEGGQLTPLFSWMLERDATVRIGLASYFQDTTISTFLRMPGSDYADLLRTTTTAIHEAHPDRFERFMLPGSGHVLSTDWNHATAGGVRFDGWTTAMTDRNDDAWTDILADCAYTCCYADQASCEAAPGCASVSGRDAVDHPDVFAGCVATPTGCADAVTCAIPPENDRCLQFRDSCIPNGWTATPCDSFGCPANPIEATVSDCGLAAVMQYVSGGDTGTDCGTLPATAPDPDLVAARSCATSADASKAAFAISYSQPLTAAGTLIRGGYLGLTEATGYRLYRFDYAEPNQLSMTPGSGAPPMAPVFPTSSWESCTSLAQAACTAENSPLCLACTPDGARRCQCRNDPFQGDRAAISCH